MNGIAAFFFGNEYVLYFFYGLAFVIMGFSLAIRAKSKFELGNRVWLLAGFGFVHGAAEFIHSWINLQRNYILQYDVMTALSLERILLAVSFMLLFHFGIELILLRKPQFRFARVIPALIFFSWLSYFFGWQVFTLGTGEPRNIYWSYATARYFLGLPSALITAIGLFQLKNNGQLTSPNMKKYLGGAAYSFALYSIFGGVVVRPGGFFPANLINSQILYEVTGIPVEVYRMTCAILISYFILKSLQALDAEVIRRLEIAEINHAILETREQISRDIHDGFLQSIYSVGLRLEKHLVSRRSSVKSQEIKDMEFAVNSLNDVMADIRGFINKLNLHESYSDIYKMISDFEKDFAMHPEYEFNAKVSGQPVELNQEKMLNIYYITKEALSNVKRHAQAKAVSVEFMFEENRLKVTISDDGVGLTKKSREPGYQLGMGLKNMTARARMMQGILRFNLGRGKGTNVILDIPI